MGKIDHQPVYSEINNNYRIISVAKNLWQYQHRAKGEPGRNKATSKNKKGVSIVTTAHYDPWQQMGPPVEFEAALTRLNLSTPSPEVEADRRRKEYEHQRGENAQDMN